MEAVKLESILDKHDRDPAALLAILQDIQAEENYLPREDIESVAKKLDLPLARIYSLATFFSSFSLKPRGKHICTVCMGTACHVRGAQRILEELERALGISNGETTPDQEFSLETVNCLGACALGPIMVVNGEYHGNMETTNVAGVIERYAHETEHNE